MSIHHHSENPDDPDLLKCDQKGCSKKDLRSAYRVGKRHLCAKHYRDHRKIINANREKLLGL